MEFLTETALPLVVLVGVVYFIYKRVEKKRNK